MKFSLILFGLAQMLKHSARKYPAFRERLRERDFTAQIMARDEDTGRWYTFKNGRVKSGSGKHADPDMTLGFKNEKTAARLLMPPINWLDQINAQKDFLLSVEGPEDLSNWFALTIMETQSLPWKIGTPQPDGSMHGQGRQGAGDSHSRAGAPRADRLSQ